MTVRNYLMNPGVTTPAWRAAQQRAGNLLADPCGDCGHIACPIEVDDEDSSSRDCQTCTSCATFIRD